MKLAITGRLIIIAGISILLTACDKLESKPENLTFLNGEFSITKPASWTVKQGLNDQADLQVADYGKEAYMLVLAESKQDFVDMTLQQHSDLTRSKMATSLNDFQESSREELTIDGYSAIRYVVTGNINNIKLKYWHVTVETAKTFTQLLFWSLPSKFASNEPDFTMAMNSFKDNSKRTNVRKE